MNNYLRDFVRKFGIVLLIAGNLVAERAEAQVFFHEDFNNLEVGQLTNEGGNINGTGLMSPHFEIVSPDSSFDYEVKNGERIQGGSSALKITTAPEPVTDNYIQYSFPPIGTDFCLSFLCRVPDKGVGSDTFRIQLMKGNQVGFSFVLRPYDHPDFLLFYGSESGGSFSPSSEGHTFLFIVQCKANTQNWFVDPNATNLSMKGSRSGGSIRAAEIDGIRISVNSSDLAGPATSLLIDELRLSYTLADSISGISADPNPPKPSEVEILRGEVVVLNELVSQKKAEIEAIKAQLATLVDALAAKETVVEQQSLRLAEVEAQRDARPTQAEFDKVVAERDERVTLEEVQDARSGSVILTPDIAGNVQVKLEIEESSDLDVWLNQGKKLEAVFPLAEGKRFFRFAIE